jgi:hypothetical protein
VPNNIKRGVRLGSFWSPCLFNLYPEEIFKDINELADLNINRTAINYLMYADDTVLVAEKIAASIYTNKHKAMNMDFH